MKIHEYQSRELLQKFGVPVPGGVVVENADEAEAAFTKLAGDGATLAVVKAQVHAGGRGKGGGVKLVRSAAEAKEAAATILSKPLVTPQTTAEGVPVHKLLIADGVDIEKEYYLGVVVDRARGCPVMMGSSEGGMDIEEVAAKTPEKIIKEPIDPAAGFQGYQARKLAFAMGFEGKQVGQAVKVMMKLAALFVATDASLVEINPLIVTPASEAHPDGEVLAIDAKIDFDDNAMFRQKAIKALEDPEEVDAAEAKASEFGLSYINLDGNIGCLVNGAGLAMATMDIIKLHGGEPANFLDVGGSATQEAVTEAFRIILADEGVKGILVNIFGGIAKCDTIANAIVAAAKDVGFSVPLVVRLEGTNVEPAREIIEAAKADIPTMIVGSNLTDAAQKITAAIAA
ncbi:MAG: ADP-forming succinate--CoA ligase subunit beta [Planctomycetota bacterium]